MTDIHNLSRNKYPKLYTIIASIFKKMLPSFQWISGYDFEKENIKDFKVIVKMMNYELLPDVEEYQSMRHREGHPQENIIASGIYYYYKTDGIENDIFKIDHEFKVNPYRGGTKYIEEKVNVQQNNFIVFNNRSGFQHHLSSLSRNNGEYIEQRKILAIFLVDPIRMSA